MKRGRKEHGAETHPIKLMPQLLRRHTIGEISATALAVW